MESYMTFNEKDPFYADFLFGGFFDIDRLPEFLKPRLDVQEQISGKRPDRIG